MSHDLLVTSSLSDSSNSNHSNHCNDPLIGQQFASSILLADLAIQSTAYIPSTSAAAHDEKKDTKKAKRRVTFKDDIQVQMIPIYSSCSSASSSSEEEDLPQPKEPVIPSERISKKAAYDALQYRKQVRRTTHPTSKSGFWYPLNPPTTTTTTNNGMVRHSSHPLPALRSLEMTEQLISDSIEREMALYPNLRQQEDQEILASPLPPPSPPLDTNNTTSILIIDSDEEEEEEEEHNTSEYFTTQEEHDDDDEDIIYQTRHDIYQSSVDSKHEEEEEEEDDHYQTRLEIAELEKTPSLENEANNEHSIMQHSANSMYIEDSDTSVTTSSPTGFEEKFQAEDVISSFEKYSPPELTLPFEKKFISISTKSSSNIPTFIHPVHHLFFIKVLKAEHLDFPVENDNTSIYCSIRYKDTETRSQHQQLAHTMDINHEMRIVDVDPDQQIALTIHVERGKKSNPAFSTWYHKIKSSSDLQRYVHEKDGSICQTLFSPDRFMNGSSLEQTASLMLVNGWYRILLNNNSSSSLLSFKKKKPTAPAALAREKAVGKVVVQCLSVEAYGDRLPETMDEAIEGINANRFHQTVWQSGYLSQCGEDEREFTRRYFTLRGGILCAFTQDRIALHQISLSRVVKLACNTHIIAERPSHYHTMKTPTTLLSQLEQVIMTRDEDDSSIHEENGFQLYLDNGDIIQFGCESLEERNKWVSIIEVMICKLPVLPDWIKP